MSRKLTGALVLFLKRYFSVPGMNITLFGASWMCRPADAFSFRRVPSEMPTTTASRPAIGG